MKKVLVLAMCILALSGQAVAQSYVRNDGMVVTPQPGIGKALGEMAIAVATLPVAIIGGVAKAFVGGPDIVETKEQYQQRIATERATQIRTRTVITYYDPYMYAPPFWPGYPIRGWYVQARYPNMVFFIGRDGRHHGHHHH